MQQSIAGGQELVGPAVVMAHRLRKDGSGRAHPRVVHATKSARSGEASAGPAIAPSPPVTGNNPSPSFSELNATRTHHATCFV